MQVEDLILHELLDDQVKRRFLLVLYVEQQKFCRIGEFLCGVVLVRHVEN